MIDHEKVEQAVRLYLEGIGEDVNRRRSYRYTRQDRPECMKRDIWWNGRRWEFIL